MADARVGIEIEARDNARAAIDGAKRALDDLSKRVDALKTSSGGAEAIVNALNRSIDSQNRSASAASKQLDAIRKSTDESAKASNFLVGTLQAMASEMAAVRQESDQLAESQRKAEEAAQRLAANLKQEAEIDAIVERNTMFMVRGFLAFSAAAVFAAKQAAAYQGQLDQLATSTGLTTGQVAGLRVAAMETGVSFDQVRSGVEQFTKRIGDAASGNRAADEGFARLGIALRNADGSLRSTGDILKSVQDGLRGIRDPAERAAIATQLFGRAGVSSLSALLVPIDGAEKRARKMLLVFGRDGEEQARRANRAFSEFGGTVAGLRNVFGILVAKGLAPFTDAVHDAVGAIVEFMNKPEVKEFLALQNQGSPRTEQESFDALQRNPVRQFLLGATGQTEGPRPQVVFSNAGQALDLAQSLRTGGENPFSGSFNLLEPNRDLVDAIEERAKAEREAAKFAKSVADAQRKGFTGALDSALAPIPLGSLSPVRDARGTTSTDRYLGGTASIMQAPDDLTAENLKRVAEALRLVDNDSSRLAEGLALLDPATAAAAESARNFAETLVTGVADAFAGLVSMMIRGTEDIGAAFENLLADILASIAAGAVRKGIASLIPGVGAFLQSGGTFVKAQSGLVVQGVRGIDTVPALLGRGETVLDHSLTDQLRLFLSEMKRSIVPRAPTPAAAAAGNITVNFHYSAGGGQSPERDRLQLNQYLRDTMMPELRKVIERGARI